MPGTGTFGVSTDEAAELGDADGDQILNLTVNALSAMDGVDSDDGKLDSLVISLCHICCNPITTDDCLECFGRCKQHVHTSCLAIPEQEIEVLQKNKNAAYVCDTCFALHGYDDSAKAEEILKEVVSKLDTLQCLVNFVDTFDQKMRKIVREECSKIVAGKVKPDVNVDVTPGRVVRSARRRKAAAQANVNSVANPVVSSVNVSETPKSSAPSLFSEVVKRRTMIGRSGGSGSVKVTQKPNPKLVIKAKSQSDVLKIGKVMREKIDRKSLNIKDVKTRRDGAVVVELLNDESMNELKGRVGKCMGDAYEAVISEVPKPTIKMLGLSEILEEVAFREALIQDNAILCEMKHFKLRKFVAASKVVDCRFNAIFEVDASTYYKILDQGKLLCNWDSCRVFDGLDVLRCYKCCCFNHKGAECSETSETCPRCAGSHGVKDCQSTVLKCANCA